MKSIARPSLPEFGTKAELFAHLRENVKSIIAQKKAFPTTSDDLDFGYSLKTEALTFVGKSNIKKANEEEEQDLSTLSELSVDVIGNLAGWCDSYMDVMIKDNWKKSISDAGASGEKLVYHLKDHIYTTSAIVGKDVSLYVKDIDLSRFNITTDLKKAQALMMSSTVVKEYDSKTFMLYRDKQVKQHSIGLS